MRLNKFRLAIRFLILLAVTSIPFSAIAQNTAVNSSERVRDLKLDSKLMKREMPYRVILPVGYNAPDEKPNVYPTVYLLHGLTGSFSNWTNFSKLEEYSRDYKYVIVMPEGNNGWYTDSATRENDKYESYIITELAAEIEKKFRVKKSRESRAIAGLSMGGFGAMKFAVKYPEKFVLAGSFSGALMAAEWSETQLSTTGWKVLVDSVSNAFGAPDSEIRKQNDIFGIIGAKEPSDLKSLPFLYMDCGTEDILVLENQKFAKLLLEKKVAHEFRQLPGAHNWKFWDAQIQEFLKVSKKFVK